MESSKESTNSILIKQILDEINLMKSKLPNGELKYMRDSVEEMRNNFKEIKNDFSEIKKKLLDPDDGVIVKVNENTKFRLQEEAKSDEYNNLKIDIESFKRWQSGANKALWIIFAALIAIVLKIIFGIDA